MSEKWRATVKLKDPEGILHTCYQEAGKTNPQLRKKRCDDVIGEVKDKIAGLKLINQNGLPGFEVGGSSDDLEKLKTLIEDEMEIGRVNIYQVWS